MIAVRIAGLAWATLFTLIVAAIITGSITAAIHDRRVRRRRQRADLETVRKLGADWIAWDKSMPKSHGWSRSRV